MKGDEGSVLVVDDNEVNRDLLARRLQRQGDAVIAEDWFQVNPVLRAARIGAGWQKKPRRDREQADLQKWTDEQFKSEGLLPKEETNG